MYYCLRSRSSVLAPCLSGTERSCCRPSCHWGAHCTSNCHRQRLCWGRAKQESAVLLFLICMFRGVDLRFREIEPTRTEHPNREVVLSRLCVRRAALFMSGLSSSMLPVVVFECMSFSKPTFLLQLLLGHLPCAGRAMVQATAGDVFWVSRCLPGQPPCACGMALPC